MENSASAVFLGSVPLVVEGLSSGIDFTCLISSPSRSRGTVYSCPKVPVCTLAQ